MSAKDIIIIIEILKEKYLSHIDSGEYSAAIDVHDEITRWQNELGRKLLLEKKLKRSDKKGI